MMNVLRGEARVLLVAADRALLYTGHGGRLTHAYEFAAGEGGWSAFSHYLEQAGAAPLHVLVDVVEEEYRQDTIPHVRGGDRRAVLARKYARLFRGTPYCLALAQGREREGRRDDRVLLTALTKPETLAPWIAEILKHRVPLAGIHSVPILSAALLKAVKATASNVLFISVQQVSGLRQTFFRDGQLKISRLAQMPRLGSVPYANHVLAELAKLRRYLNSLALVSRDSPLAIYLFSHGELLQELERHCRSSDGEQYFLVDTADLAPRLGLPAESVSPYADALFAQLLLDAPPSVHYAQRQETRFHLLHQWKIALLAASVLLIVGSAGWSALRFVEGVGLKQQALDAAQKSVFYQERLALARRDLPPTPLDASAIDTAVRTADALVSLRASPLPAWRLLGAALESAPAIVLDRLTWQRSFVPDPDGKPAPGTPEPPAPAAADDAYYAITDVEGHLAAFDGDFRGALATIDALAARLREQQDVRSVTVTRYPLDLDPDASVTGSAGAADPAAGFTLRIVLGVAHAARQG
ncbi:MAG: hypothetical protein AB7O21_10355 [Gammaproteobacteria bacterium]